MRLRRDLSHSASQSEAERHKAFAELEKQLATAEACACGALSYAHGKATCGIMLYAGLDIIVRSFRRLEGLSFNESFS
jgi:hypothetical protein